ncbi:hypothetical protein E2C01_076965 [Portunus trituberculatus]|uniref:Uncharacterized protein n=1 Tax=Portunus trituberculatus TaxID=210409 RepID=A0A5B7IL07_PORTR|nr:hypothetical protein [Portunus trituberculatus]
MHNLLLEGKKSSSIFLTFVSQPFPIRFLRQAQPFYQGRLETRPGHSFAGLLICHQPTIGYRSSPQLVWNGQWWGTLKAAWRTRFARLTFHYKTTCDNAFYLLYTLLQRQLQNWSKSECVPIPSTA